MTKRRRIETVLCGEKPDRTPFALWMHSSVHERTVEKFSQFTLDFYRNYDPDLVKVMYDENYDTPVNYDFVVSPEVWRLFEEFDPGLGAFGRQIEALRRAEILVLHLHGEEDIYFRLLEDYPCDAVSWEERVAGPPISEARDLTACCLMGGIDHMAARRCTPQDIVRQGKQAIRDAGSHGLILAPGCTFFNDTPEKNMLAVKLAAVEGSG